MSDKTTLDWQNKPVNEKENEHTRIFVWCIEPHHNRDADYTVVRGYANAVKAAQDAIAKVMDEAEQSDRGCIEPQTVRVWTETMTLGEYEGMRES